MIPRQAAPGAYQSTGPRVMANMITQLRGYLIYQEPASNANAIHAFRELLQHCIFSFCSEKEGNVRIGTFPECQEVLICSLSFDRLSLQSQRTCKS